ncbi:MAG: stage II sporulation protein M [Terriglobia bacterium]
MRPGSVQPARELDFTALSRRMQRWGMALAGSTEDYRLKMISTRWLQQRQPHWNRLNEILDRAGRRGVSALSAPQLQELSLLYRQVAADLATVREDPSSRRLAEFLNQLLARAHNLIYVERRSGPLGVVTFYTRGFPRVFRATLDYTLAAFIVFLGSAVAGFLAALADPAFQRFFLPGPLEQTIERGHMWTHSILTLKPLASSAIMTNNLTVAFTMFGLGITAGLGTAYLLATNGLLLGVIGAACWQAGMATKFWSFVAPHGALELPSIFIAGGAGFLVARGMLFPGPLPRQEAIVFYGAQGVRLVVGIIPLLVIAGVMEAFVSPTGISAAWKFGLGAALGLTLALYLAQGIKPKRTSGASPRAEAGDPGLS